ncbi:hypothetical protein ACCO45_006810 [Purpureocillium lilacinum]|uniref:Uncharacterized protein n=1 Tax=Purpureocillium lilacinum TaxID=33203 RepID=A0ACC4DRC0_PURLI
MPKIGRNHARFQGARVRVRGNRAPKEMGVASSPLAPELHVDLTCAWRLLGRYTRRQIFPIEVHGALAGPGGRYCPSHLRR